MSRPLERSEVITSVRLTGRATHALVSQVPVLLRDHLELAVRDTDLRDVVVSAGQVGGEVSLLVRIPMATEDLLTGLVTGLAHVRVAVEAVCKTFQDQGLMLHEDSVGTRWRGARDNL